MNLASIHWLPLVATAIVVLVQTANCQEPLEQGTRLQDLPEQAQRYFRVVSDTDDVYQITIDGLIHRNVVHRRVYRTPLPLIELLSESAIATDLEIVGSQRAKLEGQIRELKKACDQAGTAYDKWSSDRDRLETETLNILEPAVDDAIRAIRDSLVGVQADRFKQILVQLEISRRGILWFLESKMGDDIGLSPSQKKALRIRYVEEIQIASKEIQDHKQKAIQELFSLVPRGTKNDMLETVGDSANLYRTPLILLALQLDEEAVKSFSKYDAESRWPKYSGLSYPFSFKVDAAGKFVIAHPEDDAESVAKAIPGYLMFYCLSGGELELVSEQKNAIADLRRQQRAFWQSQSDSYNQFIQTNNTWTLPPELRQKRRKAKLEFDNLLVETIEKILLPHQLSVMEEFAARTRYSLHGPVAFIVNYEERTKDFVLTASQKDKLWKTANSVRDAATEKLVELEKRLNQRMLKELTDEQKQRLDLLTGRWLQLESGNLEFHATLIERPDEIWGLNQQPIWMDDVEVDPRGVDAPSDSPESRDNNTMHAKPGLRADFSA